MSKGKPRIKGQQQLLYFELFMGICENPGKIIYCFQIKKEGNLVFSHLPTKLLLFIVGLKLVISNRIQKKNGGMFKARFLVRVLTYEMC